MSVNYIFYVHDCLRFPQCAIHFTFQTSVQIKHFILEHHLTHHTSTSILTHICDQKKKQQADHSDWYNPTDLLHLCLHYTVTQMMTPRCVHWRRGEDQGRGLRCPPERECWHIYWKGGDLTISKIREGADHRGGVAIPDWTNHPHSHIQEAEF